jgi:hypothetical protein
MSEQFIIQATVTISLLLMLNSIPYDSDYIDDCVDSYKKYRKNRKGKQTH